MIRRSHPFSILEIIIATFLFSIVLGTTSSLFFRYQKLSAKLESFRPKVLERTLFYEKFLEMSLTIREESLQEDHTMYENLLTFKYNNAYKQNPGVAGECTCKLYKDENNHLIYHITNSKGQEAKRIFLQDISRFKATWKKRHLELHFKDLQGREFSYLFLLSKQKGGK
ncbi:hypothetical protein K0U07_05110 [bacterium]|nr:hypothetical protein [bacterium]